MLASPPRRILCIKLKHVGDVLLMTPAIRALRRAWPTSTIGALVPMGTAEVLAGNPDLDTVLVFNRKAGGAGAWKAIREVRRFGPDLVLEMGQGDREAVIGWLSRAKHRVGYAPNRSGGWRRLLLNRTVPWNGMQHVVDTNLDLVRACGIAAIATRPVVVVHPEGRSRMLAYLKSMGVSPHNPLVVIHPVSRWLFKAWPEASCAEVIQGLVRKADITVAVTSGPEAAEVAAANRIVTRAGAAVINLVGRTTLPELAALLERAQLFIGVDSAPTHMAAALGTPVVALFGPSGEVSWGPWGDGHVVISSPYLCRPCGKDGCLGSKRSDCLEAISAQSILDAAERLLTRALASA
jgi:heptosyltransferase-3